MMKSSHSKGKTKEREFLTWICSGIGEPSTFEGFVFPMNKWGSNDAFGIFDGFYLGSGGGVFFFQICHRSTKKRHAEAIERFVDAHPARNYTICLYSWDSASERKGMPFRLIRAW